ncbi:hypothetical protein ACI65C_012255 [Semiaphis heraclei]
MYTACIMIILVIVKLLNIKPFLKTNGCPGMEDTPPPQKKIRQYNKLNLTILTSVNDDSDGCGAKFSVVVVSDKFNGKTLLQRHRMVNDVLAEELKEIHAFSQKTLTTEQWNNLNKV